MSTFIDFLFSTKYWPPRWYCGQWTDTLGWVHIISDLAIFLAYASIPAILVFWCIKRRDIPFNYLLVLFALFIISCGTVHLIEAIIFWQPVYRFDGLMKMVTATVSWVTVIALIPAIPKVLNLPALEKMNQILQQKTTETEKKLQKTVVELRDVKKVTDDFLYVISHDLRGPLINIKGFSNELSDAFAIIHSEIHHLEGKINKERYQQIEQLLQNEIPQSFTFINEAVRKIDFLVEELLKLSRLTRREIMVEQLNMQEIVENQLDALADQIKHNNMEIILKELPPISADKKAMEQVFYALIDNAIKYRDLNKQGKIEISAEEKSDHILFSVQDNGIGIDEKDRKKIFTLFDRVDPVAGDGSGMGLVYVKILLQLHKGTIDYSSIPGEGSTFFVTLPTNIQEELASGQTV